MNWKLLLLVIIVGGVVWALRGESALSAEKAREYLKAGALLVDVRTGEEFKSGSLPGAVNLPVDSIKTGITNQVTDKSKVVLLHCRSGRRSAAAEKELRAMGYTNAFNIGSYEQAKKLVQAKQAE
jgi:phage shock protein E